MRHLQIVKQNSSLGIMTRQTKGNYEAMASLERFELSTHCLEGMEETVRTASPLRTSQSWSTS